MIYVTVTVTWRPMTSGMNGTRMCCCTCRHDRRLSCKNEIACEVESEMSTRENRDRASSDSQYEDESESQRPGGGRRV